MSTVVSSAEELKNLHCASAKKQRADSNNTSHISTIRVFREIETVDRDRYIDRLVVQAIAENGEAVPNELIQFDVLDSENTGTFFIFVDEGKEYPVTTTFDFTSAEGFIVLNDQLRTGSQPGTVTVRVTAPYSGSDAQATFTRHLSAQTPAFIEALSGGNEFFPADSYVLVDVTTQLLDTISQPIPFGNIRFSIHDPFETGTIMIFLEHQILYTSIGVKSDGTVAAQLPVLVGNKNIGRDFYIRADREGQAPSYPFKYTTLPA